ncbi:SMC family ATPase [Candidatus Woesearchaeota archaeon]|jgi:DNA repair protein SbcC/Rad50|nr:SMC family ATPase [Candidatus Woesearchaeota archaeon]
MILKKLKLHNIRSYKQDEISFPEGIVLLSGDIGAGKSTVLLAIEFALFGMSRKTLTGDLLLRHGKHEGSVELHFALKLGNTYKEIIIKRNLRRANQVKQESGYIIIDNIKTDCTPVELKTRVLELLGYPQDMVTKATDIIYRYTVYTPQEQMKQILFENSNTRLETLRKVFDIDKYKRINENLWVVVKEYKNKRTELTGVTSNLEEKNKLMQEKKEQKKLLETKSKSMTPESEKVKDNILKKRSSQEEFEIKIKQLNELKNQESIIEVKLKNFEEQNQYNTKNKTLLLEQIKKLEDDITNFKIIKPEDVNKENLQKELEMDEHNIDKLKEKKINLTKEVEFNNTKISEISKEIEEKRNSTKELTKNKHDLDILIQELKQLDYLESEIENLNKQINGIDLNIKEKQVQIDNSLNLKKEILGIEKCPTCLQDIKQDHKDNISFTEDKKIKKYNELITEIEIQRKETAKKREEKIEILEKLKLKQKEFEKLKAEFKLVETYAHELEKKQKILQELVNVRNKLNEEKSAIDNQDPQIIRDRINMRRELLDKVKRYDDQIKQKQLIEKSYEEKNKQLQDLNMSLENSEKEINEFTTKQKDVVVKIKSFENVEEKFNLIKKEIDELLIQEKNLDLEIEGIKRQVEGVDEYLIQLDKDISEKEKAKQKINELTGFINWAEDFFANLMKTMEKHIMMKLYQEFNELFIKWFDTLIEEENLTARLSDDFTPQIVQNGYETSIQNLSGGERSAVALAYRLALNKVINSFITTINTKDIIILDEPTDGFSQEQLDKIKDVLDELNIKQILLVSHESKIESFAEHIIRIAKSEHVSCIV